jgi:hypothetical protein
LIFRDSVIADSGISTLQNLRGVHDGEDEEDVVVVVAAVAVVCGVVIELFFGVSRLL